MTSEINFAEEQKAAGAFNKQSLVFDEQYSKNEIIQYKRQRVRKHVESFLPPGSSILELNAGTGEDAVYFAGKGHFVHATDIAGDMQQVLLKKAKEAMLADHISTEICSFTALEDLENKEPYDLVFSNFAGLNCTGQLDKVLSSFPALVKPEGYITLVVLPKFCLWETMLFFRGKFKTAFRRFLSSKGRKAHVEGVFFKCWYYNPAYIKRLLKKDFDFVKIEGLCTLVPPSYIKDFDKKHPTAYSFLQKKENKLKSKWPWRSIGDYYIISFKKKI
jgi:ubiquinone/menaquinone biosynthesis C-methylase UbiE